MADERKYYCFCDSNCKFETLTREQILTAIEQAVKTGEIHDVDCGFITTVKTVNNKSVKFFFGTEAEYNALDPEVRKNLIPYKTDDSLMQSLAEIIEDAKIDKVPRMAVIDNATIESNAKDSERPYSKELDDILLGKDRVYVEGKNHSGVMRTFALTYDSEKVYNPFGYTSLEAMCAAHSWNIADVKEGEHYITKTINGATSYHSWISTIVQRQRDGNIRVGTPKDSSDATPKSYVDDKLGGATVKAETNHSKDRSTIPLRDKNGEMRCVTNDSFDSTACVNRGYLNTRLGGATVKAQTAYSKEFTTIPLRDKNGEMRCVTNDSFDSTACVNRGYLNTKLSSVTAIAKGRATGYVFDTVADLDTWLANSENKAKLVVGDNFYIKAVDVPDYWWDGSTKQQLETQKVDLSEYAKTTDIPTDENIKAFISEALGAIENGTY